ncbi:MULTISPECIES: protein NO VEIN domain-containing protein [unclassified Bradyrhizobium]|uniref:protein NO VEIN domain-containing protein n=1 Tax=unclassified Bradyrhizobium TaxID=2631580 RepID=UPI002915FE5E|nr:MULTISPECIES: DUF3883 domain-containing protein [unclassified Bradyrhizobium]
MVFKFDFDRLCRAGRIDLAKEMDWPADRGEDHRGYDIRSLETDGEERLMEIKTTNGTRGLDSGCHVISTKLPLRTRRITASGKSSISKTALRCLKSNHRSTPADDSSRTSTWLCPGKLFRGAVGSNLFGQAVSQWSYGSLPPEVVREGYSFRKLIESASLACSQTAPRLR